MAAERLDEAGTAKLRGVLLAGDPHSQVYEAWAVDEGLRDLTPLGRPGPPRRWLNALIDECCTSTGPEVRGMARTLRRWRNQLLAWHTTGVSAACRGPELAVKKIKRVAAGSRSFASLPAPDPARLRHCNWALLGTPPR